MKYSLKTLINRMPFYPFLLLIPALIFAHNPHAILHAEFWGEDGPTWYAQARSMGMASLLNADGGYLNSVQRLAANAAQPFPLAWGPTLFALFALGMQSAPAIFLLSGRMSVAWPDKASRVLFVLLFALMPNAPETALNVTDSQWYLAILAFLVIVSDAPKNKLASLFDAMVLIVSGLSGPFGVLFLPIAFLRIFRGDPVLRHVRVWRTIWLATTSCIQIFLILGLSDAGRQTGPLGASPELLVKIVAMIPLGAIGGYTGAMSLLQQSIFSGLAIPLSITIVTILIFLFGFFRGPPVLREFIFFATTMFALALYKPLISLTTDQWPMLLTPPAGNRYFLYPMIAWWGALFAVASVRNIFSRGLGFVLLAATFVVAVPLDWGDLFKLPETDFVAKAHQFDASQIGTMIAFPVHPPNVQMHLVQNQIPAGSAQVSLDESDMQRSHSGICVIDSLNGKPANVKHLAAHPADVFSFIGWAVPGTKKRTDRALLVLAGASSHYAFSTGLGLFRTDVVANLKAPEALKSGYSSAMSFAGIPAGSYTLELLVSGPGTEEICDTGFHIAVSDK